MGLQSVKEKEMHERKEVASLRPRSVPPVINTSLRSPDQRLWSYCSVQSVGGIGDRWILRNLTSSGKMGRGSGAL